MRGTLLDACLRHADCLFPRTRRDAHENKLFAGEHFRCVEFGASWSGRRAFQSLVNPYRLNQRRQFPICVLSTKPRNNVNGK